MTTLMSIGDATRINEYMEHYTTLTLRGTNYISLLLKDDKPILGADGLPVQYRSNNEAGIDMRKRAIEDALALDPPGDDPAPETGLGSSDDEGDEYPRTAVRHATA